MRNPNHELENRHVYILADSGQGKSNRMREQIPKKGVRTVFWDTNEDHGKTIKCYSLAEFFRKLQVLDKKSKNTSAGFRLAYVGTECPKRFELWCQGVAAVLDGRFETHIVISELAGAAESAGKAKEHFKRLLNQGRKYNGILYMDTQRPQEAPKTAFSQARFLHAGVFSIEADIEYISKNCGMDKMTLKSLERYQFLVRDSADPTQPQTVQKSQKTPV